MPQEAGFLVVLWEEFADFSGGELEIDRFIAALQASPKFENWKLSNDQLRAGLIHRTPSNYAALIDAVYRTYIDVWQPGKKIWGDKNNFFLRKVNFLSSVYPSAKFIHLVRDGRDVACSYRGLSQVEGKHAPRFSSDLLSAADSWRMNMRKIKTSFKDIAEEQCMQVRYEDLVENPKGELVRIVQFLGYEYAPEMLNYYDEKYSHHYEPASFDKWKKMNKSAVSATKIGRWQREMFAEDVYIFQKLAGKELQQFNYPLVETEFSWRNLIKKIIKGKFK